MCDRSSVIVKLVSEKHVNVEQNKDDFKPTKVHNSSDNDFDEVDKRLNREFTAPDDNQRALVNHGDS